MSSVARKAGGVRRRASTPWLSRVNGGAKTYWLSRDKSIMRRGGGLLSGRGTANRRERKQGWGGTGETTPLRTQSRMGSRRAGWCWVDEGRQRGGGSATQDQWKPRRTVVAGSGGAPVHLAANRASCPPLLMSAPPPRPSGFVRGFGGRTWIPAVEACATAGTPIVPPKKGTSPARRPVPWRNRTPTPPRSAGLWGWRSCADLCPEVCHLASEIGEDPASQLVGRRWWTAGGGWRQGTRVPVSTPAGATSPWDETLVQPTAWRLKGETSCMVSKRWCVQSRLEER